MNIGKIIRKARMDGGYTLKHVESATGVMTATQSKIELGDIPSPGFIQIGKLAQFYGLSLDGLFESAIDGLDTPVSAAKAYPCQHIPIISWVQAGAWCESTPQEHDFEVVTSPFKCSKHAFALKVKGDSMTAPTGAEQSYAEGSVIIVDPTIEATNKSLVVARLESSNEATFKRLVIGDTKYLQPLNPQFPIIPINEPVVICGVVLGSIQNSK